MTTFRYLITAEDAGDQIQHIRRIRGLVVSRAWLFAERRSSGVSALWLLKKSRSKRYKACSDVVGVKGFEPPASCSQTDL